MADAIAAEDLKPRQEAISREMATMRARQAEQGADAGRLHRRLDEVIQMVHNAAQLYEIAPDSTKQHLLHAIFSEIRVELEDDFGNPAVSNKTETVAASNGALTSVAEAVLDVVREGGATTQGNKERTPGKISLSGGSNVTCKWRAY